jgi:hypothetical protein
MNLSNFRCPKCNAALELEGVSEGEIIDCPQCTMAFELQTQKKVMRVAPKPQNLVRMKRKAELIGKGCFVQGVGLILCFLFSPFGLIAGICILVVGGRMAYKLTCGSCGNKIEDKDVKMCPVCKANLIP